MRKNQSKGGINSGKTRQRQKTIREAMQALLSGTYNLKDKNTGEIRILKGEDAIALAIMQTAMNPKDKNWARAVQYALQLDGSDVSPDDKRKNKEEIKLIKAKIKQVEQGGAGADVEDLTALARLLSIGAKNDEDTNDTVESVQP